MAGLEPEIAPKNSQVPTVVRPMLPRTPPSSDCTQRIRRSEMPPLLRISPAKMKNGTASRANLSIEPNIICGTAVSGTFITRTSASVAVASRMMKIGMPANSSTNGRAMSRNPAAIAMPPARGTGALVTSPTAKTPGTLVSSRYGSRSSS